MEASEFHCRLRVTSGSPGSGTVFARKHQLAVGAPVHYDPEYGQLSALEVALGAVGAELVNGLTLLAKEKRVPLERVEALVQGALNDPLAQAGVVGAQGHAGLDRLAIQVYASTLGDEQEVYPLWEEVLRRSPLTLALRRAVSLELSLKVT